MSLSYVTPYIKISEKLAVRLVSAKPRSWPHGMWFRTMYGYLDGYMRRPNGLEMFLAHPQSSTNQALSRSLSDYRRHEGEWFSGQETGQQTQALAGSRPLQCHCGAHPPVRNTLHFSKKKTVTDLYLLL